MKTPAERYGAYSGSFPNASVFLTPEFPTRQRKRRWALWRQHKEGVIDVAVIPHKNGRYFTYRCIDKEPWPPSMKELVSNTALPNHPRSDLSSKIYTLRQIICFLRISKVKARAVIYNSEQVWKIENVVRSDVTVNFNT
jgi:hypothetical protein